MQTIPWTALRRMTLAIHLTTIQMAMNMITMAHLLFIVAVTMKVAASTITRTKKCLPTTVEAPAAATIKGEGNQGGGTIQVAVEETRDHRIVVLAARIVTNLTILPAKRNREGNLKDVKDDGKFKRILCLFLKMIFSSHILFGRACFCIPFWIDLFCSDTS